MQVLVMDQVVVFNTQELVELVPNPLKQVNTDCVNSQQFIALITEIFFFT